MKLKKEWTVLIYANGNNDLDTNIYRQFQLLKAARLPANINVVIQIAGFHQQQPVDDNKISLEKELAVCRYQIVHNKAFLIKNLEETSMANPAAFLDFLLWGIKEFPSENLMLIISGHGFGFMGLLGDCIDKNIHLMSLQGFTNTLSKFRQRTNKVINILVFDVCYINLIEVIYEIALTPRNAVYYMILAQGNPPVEGLSWPAIINSLKADILYPEITIQNVCEIVLSINKIHVGDSAVFAICLMPDYFTRLKALTDQLSGLILKNTLKTEIGFIGSGFGQKDGTFISLPYFLSQLRKKYHEVGDLEAEFIDILNQIVLYPNLCEIKKEENLGINIFLPNNPKDYLQIRNYYDNLLFCQNNRWLNIIAGSL